MIDPDATLQHWLEMRRDDPWRERVQPLVDVASRLVAEHSKGVTGHRIAVEDGAMELEREEGDAAQDQRRLAGVLWLALYGEPAPADLGALPDDPEVPREVGEVVRRALLQSQWPSTAAFLDALAQAAAPRGMTTALIVKIGVAGALIGVAIAVVQMFTGSTCEPPRDVPWPAARIDGVADSVYRAGGDADALRVAAKAFSARWTAAYAAACEAEDAAARPCLREAHAAAERAVQQLEILDPEAMAAPGAMIDGLPDPSACLSR